MVTPELSAYIKAQRGFNVAKQPIVDALLSVGWQRIDIDEAFALLNTDPKRAPDGTIAAPDFLGDGVTIFEDTVSDGQTANSNPPAGGAKGQDLKVRFPEGLKVMPKPAENAFAKEGGVPMRPAEDAPPKKNNAALKGLLYAALVLIALGVAAGTVYVLNPSLLGAVVSR